MNKLRTVTSSPLFRTFIVGLISGAALDYTLMKSSYYRILLEEQAKLRVKQQIELFESIERVQNKYPGIFDDIQE
jgi:hypothetical protein